MNNIFDFATKELSQDAVICWMLNWVKYPESELFELGKDMFALLGEKEINVNQKITIKTQFKKADIVVVLHGERRIIIIEDKVYSTEHDNQIDLYKKTISDSEVQKELDVTGDAITDIRTVYFKTGFFYDYDKLIVAKKKANIIVHGIDFLKVIEPYALCTESEILKTYAIHLKELIGWYDEHGDFTKRTNDGNYYISQFEIAQYRFIRTIFPEEKWNKHTGEFFVENGSSSGRPWTETCICPEMYYSDGSSFCFFWRVDSDKGGPYLSLRFYDSFARNGDEEMQRHKKYYNNLVSYAKQIVESSEDNTGILWAKVHCGYTGSYKESALLTIHLSESLEKWEEKGKDLVRAVRLLTEEFSRCVREKLANK